MPVSGQSIHLKYPYIFKYCKLDIAWYFHVMLIPVDPICWEALYLPPFPSKIEAFSKLFEYLSNIQICLLNTKYE